MTASLDNIISSLEMAKKQIKCSSNSDLLVCLGGPGSGTSTLMSSLSYGKSKMTLKKF